MRCSIDMSILKEVFRVSVWSMLQFFMSVVIWFLFFLAIERLGETELAVSNIIRSISALFSVIVNALAAVTSSLVSNLLGANEKKSVFTLCHRIIRLGYLAGIPLIISALLFHPAIIGAYTDTPAIVQAAWPPLAVMLLNYFFAETIDFGVCLWLLSSRDVPLAAYWAVEYVFVILLGIQSVIYLKYKRY